MVKYFINRLLRRKLCWFAFAVGCAISVYYFVHDVVGAYNLYEATVYTMWIETFTGSDIPSMLYTVVPLLASVAAADVYLKDKNSGYLNVVFSKTSRKKYFKDLYLINFVVGGLTLLLPLALNLYLCFLVCPDRAPDMLHEGTNLVNPMKDRVLFAAMYYEHPFLHACIYVVLGFIAAGIFAIIGLALGCFVKHRFLVWIGPYIIDHVLTAISVAVSGRSLFALKNFYAMFWAVSDVTPVNTALVFGCWLLAGTMLYWIGVKKNERACI